MRTHNPSSRVLARAPLLTTAFSSPRPGVLLVEVTGELDLASAPEFDARTQHEIRTWAPRRLFIDLSRVQFLGLHGVAVFERLRRRSVADGTSVCLLGLSPAGARALQFAGVLLRFDRYPDLTTALARIDLPPAPTQPPTG